MTDIEKMTYALAMNIQGNIAELPLPIDLQLFIKAFSDLTAGKKPELSDEEFHKYMNQFQREVENAGKKALQEAAAANSKAGEEFLAQKAQEKGVVTTASGLQYKIIKQGEGAKPTKSSQVKVHYTGKLIDGTVFDSSVKRGTPAVFGVTQVIPGWTEALMLMNTGSKYELYIPAKLAYGDRGAGQVIPPGSTLIFEVELLEVK